MVVVDREEVAGGGVGEVSSGHGLSVADARRRFDADSGASTRSNSNNNSLAR